MENLEIVATDEFWGCVSRENSPKVRKLAFATYNKLMQNGLKGSNLQFERLNQAKADLHTVRAGKGPRIVGLKADGKFILLHIDSHDDAHRWAARQPKNINFRLAPIAGSGVRVAFDLDEEANTSSENRNDTGKDGDVTEGLDDVLRDLAQQERETIQARDQAIADRDEAKAILDQTVAERDRAVAERDHMIKVAAELEDLSRKDVEKASVEEDRINNAIIEAQEDTISQVESERDRALNQRDQAIAERDRAIAERDESDSAFKRQTESLQTAQSFDIKPITGFSKNEILEDVFVIIDGNKKAIALKLLNNDTLRLNNWQNGFNRLLAECKKLIGCRIRTDVWGDYSALNWFQNIYLISSEKINDPNPLGTRQDRVYFKQKREQDNQVYDEKLGLYFVENFDLENNFGGGEQQSENKVYLNCPFEEKDECKSLGARWDNEMRKWYIFADQDSEPFSRWLSSNSSRDGLPVTEIDKSKRTYLKCPFDDKDECKALGGKWDPELKKWFVPHGVGLEPFAKWMPK